MKKLKQPTSGQLTLILSVHAAITRTARGLAAAELLFPEPAS